MSKLAYLKQTVQVSAFSAGMYLELKCRLGSWHFPEQYKFNHIRQIICCQGFRVG